MMTPADSVLALAGVVRRFPPVGSSGALGAVGAGCDGNQVLGMGEVASILPIALGRPLPCPTVMSVGQGDRAVHVQVFETGYDGDGIGGQP